MVSEQVIRAQAPGEDGIWFVDGSAQKTSRTRRRENADHIGWPIQCGGEHGLHIRRHGEASHAGDNPAVAITDG